LSSQASSALVGFDTERLASGALVVGCLDSDVATTSTADDAELARILSGGRFLPPGSPGVGGRALTGSTRLAVHNSPYDLGHVPGGERTIAGIADTLGLSWLDNELPPHGLKHLARRKLGRFLEDPISVVAGVVLFDGVPIEDADPAAVERYCREDAEATRDLAAYYLDGPYALSRRQQRWYWSVEEPHLRSCIAMSRRGLPIDVEAVAPTLTHARQQSAATLESLQALAGWALNPGSPDQVSAWLYEPFVARRERRLEGRFSTGRERWRWRRMLYPGLDLDGGPGTRADDLEDLAHPAADAVLAWREWAKLVGTYLEPTAARLDSAGRLHPRINPWGTVTGRPSCSEPNLFNLPARRASGSLVRRLVKAPPGRRLVIADYSQLEPRLMAHLAGMPVADDEHQALADRLEISRTLAKEVGLASRYGAGPRKLAARLRIGESAARAFLDGFWESAPALAAWRARVVDDVRASGQIELPSGRVRHLPDAQLRRSPLAARALRQAVNVWCQGTAADVTKAAVADLWRRGVVPALQVYDSVVLEVDAADAEDAGRELTQVMSRAGRTAGVDVDLPVEVKVVERWE
jgi:DNA polymerase-1